VAVGPIKDDNAGRVNCSEVSSMQEGVARRLQKDGSLAQKGQARFDQASLKPYLVQVANLVRNSVEKEFVSEV
jgi:hypothetical protein